LLLLQKVTKVTIFSSGFLIAGLEIQVLEFWRGAISRRGPARVMSSAIFVSEGLFSHSHATDSHLPANDFNICTDQRRRCGDDRPASGISIVFAWSLTTAARPCDVATIDKARQEPVKETQAEKRVIVFWVF